VASVDGTDAHSLVEDTGARWPPATWRPEP
jgi:hypothetical protein